jgi:hypothetical protein
VTIAGGGPRWRWTLDAESATRLRRIVVPSGTYFMELTAPRHRKLTRARIVASEGSVDLGELRLRPLPIARGTVVDAEGTAVAEALVSLLIRHNGEFVPPAILRFVTGGGPVGTGRSGETVLSRLPAGAYEVWALAGDRDEEALIASNGGLRAPVRTGLSGGEELVEVVAPPAEVRRRP